MSEKVYHSGVSTAWATPRALFEALDAEFHFTLDVAATVENALCATFYTEEENGLLCAWTGVCWCNPPYGKPVRHWLAKAVQSAEAGATVVCLLPARTDTFWWHEYVLPYAEIRFLRGRLRFGDSDNAPFPSVVLVYRPPCTRVRDVSVRLRQLLLF